MKRGSLFSLALSQVALVACQAPQSVARDASATAITAEVVTVPTPQARTAEPAIPLQPPTSHVLAAPASAEIVTSSNPPALAQTPANATTPARPRMTPDGRPAAGNVVGRASRQD
jgi:hypothetical protein